MSRQTFNELVGRLNTSESVESMLEIHIEILRLAAELNSNKMLIVDTAVRGYIDIYRINKTKTDSFLNLAMDTYHS